jgi:hypothetical protein
MEEDDRRHGESIAIRGTEYEYTGNKSLCMAETRSSGSCDWLTAEVFSISIFLF